MNKNNRSSIFIVEDEKFKGPLELLLELVQKRKFLINDVSLAKVADDFIEITKHYPTSLRKSTEFLLIASTLLLIKARSLLPFFEVTQQEQDDIDELKARLKAYKQLKEAVGKLNLTPLAKPKKPQPIRINGPIYPPDFTITHLTKAIEALFEDLKFYITPKVKVSYKISVQERVNELRKKLKAGSKISLSQIINNPDRLEAITNFLAVLELVRLNIAFLDQDGVDAQITLHDPSVPEY